MRKEVGQTSLYMLALMPPEPVARCIRQVREAFAIRFHSQAALRNPVHVTLCAPFRREEIQVSRLIPALTESCRAIDPFCLKLDGYDCFKRNRVIFIRVMDSLPLGFLYDKVRQVLDIRQEKRTEKSAFHPHITIGYRDLGREVFARAWNEYQNRAFKATFPVSEVCIWQHSGAGWETIHKCPLGPAKAEAVSFLQE